MVLSNSKVHAYSNTDFQDPITVQYSTLQVHSSNRK